MSTNVNVPVYLSKAVLVIFMFGRKLKHPVALPSQRV